ncbi:MAG TPA: ArsA-related P-loop ATPase [Acidimicrobiales bacterium]
MSPNAGPGTGFLDLGSGVSLIVACGPGGVGKTTTAAALGLAAAVRLDARVLVLTVDPARRLADALGLSGIGNDVSEVPASFFRDAGVKAKGSLSVAMLDASASWDHLIRSTAKSAAEADEIIANPLYRNITTRFSRGHEYIAMERIFELVQTGDYDLLVLDTPPSQSAVDLLDAPERMADFFSSRLLGWLTAPLRSRLLNFATRPFTALADRVLGTQFLTDTSRFFLLLQGMYDGFVARSNKVSALFQSPSTAFLVVTTPEVIPMQEAERFLGVLSERKLHLAKVITNRVLPASLVDVSTRRLAERLATSDVDLSTETPWHDLGDKAAIRRVLGAIGDNYMNFAALAGMQRILLDAFAKDHHEAIEVPHLLDEVVDAANLLRIGNLLFEDASL